ncbi:hypothetical protein H2199_008317 [Coniosporium tulheliwenetii]|uniref:Uncharacterized protein n=1 Tax=Coniosporium tulheliwenetii TaxID=3383036 RepID=A0ACC2YLE2_9PEZI|nr:hypothetical protein H2199_008317 [Cladosporium sp. JES 115]
MKPKSILKKTTNSTNLSSPPVNPRDQRNLDIALHHARLIQQQKDAEAQILEGLEALLELPSSPQADPARPSEDDAAQFKSLITPFQPSDYDALIEERHAADLCGYALCPRPPKKDKLGGKMRIVPGSDGSPARIVPRSQLEIWCSEDCARRALYVKVQLNEEPAWTRRGGLGTDISLMVDQQEAAHTMALPIRSKKPRAEEFVQENMSQALAALALERGEKTTSGNPSRLLNDVAEKVSVKPAVAPGSRGKDDTLTHSAIEGYEPKSGKTPTATHKVDEDDDQDWGI